MSRKPLEGIRVLDLTRLLPGPMCTLHLADMGADVIKIEDPKVGDYARGAAQGTEEAPSAYFQCVNRNKRGLRLDLTKPGGQTVFLDLARGADIVVESFRPGVVERLGVDFKTVLGVNPKIVYCAITGFGQTGPYRARAGHDLNYCALTGLSDQVGQRGGPPALSNVQFADLAGGTLSAAMGILAALVDVQRGGEGRYLDVSMSDCALVNAIIPLTGLLDYGTVPARGSDMLSGALACYNVYETADGRHLTLAAPEEKFWRAFCEAIERPDLIDRRLAVGREGREVKAEVQSVIETRSLEWWVERLADVDCCAAPVLTLAETMADPHFQARGMFVETERRGAKPPAGTITQFGFPIQMSGFEFSVDRPAPHRGEHTAEILAEIGYDDDRIAALVESGVV